MPALVEILTDLQQVAGHDAENAVSLPGHFYTCPALFEHECENLLRDEWHCLGRVDEIPNPGDFFTTLLLGEPLLVVRGDDSEIRVLSNVCRHRGMPLAQGKGQVKRFVCSYHAWAYARDGKLANAPRIPKHRVADGVCDLPAFECETWNGFIYTCLSTPETRLSDRVSNLQNLVGAYDGEKFRLIFSDEEVWHTNWKCLIENFMEAYHLSVVHPETLHPYTPSGLSKKALSDAYFTSYCANYPSQIERRGQGAKALSQEERHRSTLFCLFPTQLVSQAASLLVSLSVQPISVDRINVRWTMSVYEDDYDQATIDQRIALWKQVNSEDKEKLEKMQACLSSKTVTSGPLAPPDFEGTIWDFIQYLNARLNGQKPSTR